MIVTLDLDALAQQLAEAITATERQGAALRAQRDLVAHLRAEAEEQSRADPAAAGAGPEPDAAVA